MIWLVVTQPTPLKNDGLPQLGLLFPTEWKVNPKSMVPNHQPVMGLMGPKHHWNMTRSMGQIFTGQFDHDHMLEAHFFWLVVDLPL